MRIINKLHRLARSTAAQITFGAALFVWGNYTIAARALNSNAVETTAKADNVYLSEYDPNKFTSDAKVILIPSGCWTAVANAYFDRSIKDSVADPSARIDRILNEVGQNLYDSDVTFYQAGYPEPDYAIGLKNVFNALEQPNVKAVVYINAPGGLEAFVDPRGFPGLQETLTKIEQDYPGLQEDAAFFLKQAINSIGFKENSSNKSVSNLKTYLSWIGRIKSQAIADPAIVSQIADFASSKVRASRSSTTAGQQGFSRNFLRTVDLARSNYDNDTAYDLPLRPMMSSHLFWRADGGVSDSFLRLAAGMAEKKGVRFIYYIPPHLNVTKQEYENQFKPHFVKRISDILQAYPNSVLIDHSQLAGFYPQDLAYGQNQIAKARSALNTKGPFKPFEVTYSPGYVFNMIGKIKQARTLLAALEEKGIIHLQGDPTQPTEFERDLVVSEKTKETFLSCSQYQQTYEAILDDSEYRRSLQAGTAEPPPIRFNASCKPS